MSNTEVDWQACVHAHLQRLQKRLLDVADLDSIVKCSLKLCGNVELADNPKPPLDPFFPEHMLSRPVNRFSSSGMSITTLLGAVLRERARYVL